MPVLPIALKAQWFPNSLSQSENQSKLWEERAFLLYAVKGILTKQRKQICVLKKKEEERKQTCEQVEPYHGAIGIKYLTVMETKKGS